MRNLGSFVERTVHLPLQRFTRFRPLVPLFAAIVVLPSILIVGRASSGSVSALSTALRNVITGPGTSDGVSLLRSISNIFTRALNAACLRVRIYIQVPRGPGRPRNDDARYPTPRAEAKYWSVAGRYRRRLYSGNSSSSAPPSVSTASRSSMDLPLITYYTPRLLPLYRERSGGKRTASDTAQAARVSPKMFCKWHRMVFPDSCRHPTLAEAAVQVKYYSNHDLREIRRIARLLPEEHVFGITGKGVQKAKKTRKYKEMWQNWLENKGMDLVIVFE